MLRAGFGLHRQVGRAPARLADTVVRMEPSPNPSSTTGRFWRIGSLFVLAALVVIGGSGSAERVYTTLGRYNLFIVGGIAVLVAVACRRRGRTNSNDRTTVAP